MIQIVAFDQSYALKHGICAAVFAQHIGHIGPLCEHEGLKISLGEIRKYFPIFNFSDDEILKTIYLFVNNKQAKKEWFDTSVFSDDNDLIYFAK